MGSSQRAGLNLPFIYPAGDNGCFLCSPLDILSGSLSGHLSQKAFHPKDVCASLISCIECKFCEGQNHIAVALSILMLRTQLAFKKTFDEGPKEEVKPNEGMNRLSISHVSISFAFSISLIHHTCLMTKADRVLMALSEGLVSRGESLKETILD